MIKGLYERNKLQKECNVIGDHFYQMAKKYGNPYYNENTQNSLNELIIIAQSAMTKAKIDTLREISSLLGIW